MSEARAADTKVKAAAAVIKHFLSNVIVMSCDERKCK
jgi:hypothetical protein